MSNLTQPLKTKSSKAIKILTILFSKKTWKVKSYWQLAIVFLVFSLAGSLSVKIAYPVTEFLGLHQQTTSPWLFWPIRILLILPIYQILLISIGSAFGQYQYFSKFIKKGIGRFKPHKRFMSHS